MRTYGKKLREEEIEYLTEIKCDLCGKIGDSSEIFDNYWVDYRNGNNIAETKIELEVTVRQKEGWSCRDGGSGTEYIIDMCPDCFKNKLIPWCRSQGADIKEIEWDW